ncbi:MAG: DUF2283 domain-containing protein [Candidatus Methanoperedens sp.]
MSKQKMKLLDAKGRDYDLLNDSLFFYIEGGKYKSSLEFDGIVLDFSEDANLINFEILDASEKFHISKSDLLNLKKFDSIVDINKENVKVTIKIALLKRNKVYNQCVEALTPNILKLPSGTQGITVNIEALT